MTFNVGVLFQLKVTDWNVPLVLKRHSVPVQHHAHSQTHNTQIFTKEKSTKSPAVTEIADRTGCQWPSRSAR